MVPHLLPALMGPVSELEQRFLDSMPAIERWFRLEWMEHTPLVYSSVTLRNSGFKLAPVSTNLYPSEWSQLAPEMSPLAVQAAMTAIQKICPEAKNLLIIVANKIADSNYLDSLSQLQQLFQRAGLHVRIGSIDGQLKEKNNLTVSSGESLLIEPVIREKGRIGLKDFDPCTILLNNNLIAGIPGILEDLHQQYLLPPLHGASNFRRKSNYSNCYEMVTKRMGKVLAVDPWLFTPMHETCGKLFMQEPNDMLYLKEKVNALLAKIKRKYKEYGIKEKPFVVVKADNSSACSSMAIVRDANDLQTFYFGFKEAELSGADIHPAVEILVQEGILTKEQISDSVAEPVVYMMDRYVVGGFYRIHPSMGIDDDLKAPGSSYIPISSEKESEMAQKEVEFGARRPNRFYMYGVVARLAMLASSYELEATDPDAEEYY